MESLRFSQILAMSALATTLVGCGGAGGSETSLSVTRSVVAETGQVVTANAAGMYLHRQDSSAASASLMRNGTNLGTIRWIGTNTLPILNDSGEALYYHSGSYTIASVSGDRTYPMPTSPGIDFNSPRILLDDGRVVGRYSVIGGDPGGIWVADGTAVTRFPAPSSLGSGPRVPVFVDQVGRVVVNASTNNDVHLAWVDLATGQWTTRTWSGVRSNYAMRRYGSESVLSDGGEPNPVIFHINGEANHLEASPSTTEHTFPIAALSNGVVVGVDGVGELAVWVRGKYYALEPILGETIPRVASAFQISPNEVLITYFSGLGQKVEKLTFRL